MMKEELKSLYAVKFRHTSIKYVVASSYVSKEKIKEMVRKFDDRCDDIVCVEEVKLPAFDRYIDGVERNVEFISVFVNVEVM